MTANILSNYTEGRGDDSVIFWCSADMSSYCGPSELLPLEHTNNTAYWGLSSLSPFYVRLLHLKPLIALKASYKFYLCFIASSEGALHEKNQSVPVQCLHPPAALLVLA